MIIILLWVIIALIVFLSILILLSRNHKANNTYIEISKCVAEITALQIDAECYKTSNTQRTIKGENSIWEATDFSELAKLMRDQIEILESLKKK